MRKTLKSVSEVFQNEFYCEQFIKIKGFLQVVDPRVKFITSLLLMVYSSVTKSVLSLVFLAVIAVMFAKMSGLCLSKYVKRVWLVMPLIILILSIPAATNLFVKGTPILVLIPHQLYFSVNGLTAILKMALRVGVSISFGYLLIITTKWSSITKSFALLKIPTLIISIFDMTYRYLFVLSYLVKDMMEARFLRTVGDVKNKGNRRYVSHSMAFLFIKSSFLSEEIFDAMRCRGFVGQPVSLKTFKLTSIDALFIINMGLIALVLVVGEIVF